MEGRQEPRLKTGTSSPGPVAAPSAPGSWVRDASGSWSRLVRDSSAWVCPDTRVSPSRGIGSAGIAARPARLGIHLTARREEKQRQSEPRWPRGPDAVSEKYSRCRVHRLSQHRETWVELHAVPGRPRIAEVGWDRRRRVRSCAAVRRKESGWREYFDGIVHRADHPALERGAPDARGPVERAA